MSELAVGLMSGTSLDGVEELGVDRDEHMQTVLDAMKSIADKLGL